MSNVDPTTPPAAPAPPAAAPPVAAAPPTYVPPPAYAQAPPPPAPTAYSGALGQVRPTGISMLLFFVTFGIYGFVWYYKTHEEMKQHTGQGLGGVIALLLYFFVGFVSPFISSSEVGNLYKRTGQPEPVSAVTGLWVIPGIFILVGPFIWFAKTNGALNKYWESQGVTA